MGSIELGRLIPISAQQNPHSQVTKTKRKRGKEETPNKREYPNTYNVTDINLPFSPNKIYSQSAVGGSGGSELPRWNRRGSLMY